MECLEVLDGARTPEVEGVLADPDVSRVVSLSLRDMCKLVLDRRALPQGRASHGGLDLLAESVLQRLVLRNGDGAAVPAFSRRALAAQHAAVAHVGIELHDLAERDGLHMTIGAGDGAVAEIEREGRLREQATIVRLPRLTDDSAAPAEHVVDEGAVDIAAIDQQLVDGESLPVQVGRQGGDGVFFGAIRARDGARQDQATVNVRRNVSLKAIEPLTLALAAVTHVRILDRDASILGHARTNARPPDEGIRLQILRANLREGVDLRFQRGRGGFLGQVARDPRLQRVELPGERLDRVGLLARVVPVNVERPLDTRGREQGNARLPACRPAPRSTRRRWPHTAPRCAPHGPAS